MLQELQVLEARLFHVEHIHVCEGRESPPSVFSTILGMYLLVLDPLAAWNIAIIFCPFCTDVQDIYL